MRGLCSEGEEIGLVTRLKTKVHFGPMVKSHFPSVTKGALSMCACGFSKIRMTLLGLEVYHYYKITTICSLSDA